MVAGNLLDLVRLCCQADLLRLSSTCSSSSYDLGVQVQERVALIVT